MISPLKQFLLVSIIGVTVTVASLLLLHVKLTESYVDAHLNSHNLNLAVVLRNSLLQTGLKEELVAGEPRISTATLNALVNRTETELRRIPVVKVKVYDRNGIVVYSSKESEIGEDATANKGFLSAIGGVPLSGKVHPDHVNEFDDVVEVQNLHQLYIPIHVDESEAPIGVFETYLDIAGIVADVANLQRAIFLLMGGVMILIYLALAVTFLRTHHLLKIETRQRESSLAQLRKLQASLEQRVADRTADLVEAQSQLIESRAHLQATMDNVPDAILTCNASFQIESANSSALDLFSEPETDLKGRNLIDFLVYKQVLDTGALALRSQTTLKSSQGNVFPVELWIGPLRNGFPETHYIVVIRDITAQIEAQRDLEETRDQYFHQEKMAAIGQLASGILHEVGNPIAAIAGAASEVRRALHDAPSNQDISRNLELIDQQITRLGKITRDIADFASPKPRAPELLDLNGLLKSTARLLSFDNRFRSIGIRLDLDQNLPAIVGVADQLTQVFMNLLINAMDACDPKNHKDDCIVLSTVQDGNRVHVSVRDKGSGMPAETLKHVMETFYTTKPVGKGTGLGLSLCETIVSAHGGEMHIESKEEEGTLVGVFLPVDQTEASHFNPNPMQHSGS